MKNLLFMRMKPLSDLQINDLSDIMSWSETISLPYCLIGFRILQ